MEIATALKRLENYLEAKQLITKGEKLILGVSGGADSTALLYLFSRLRYKYSLSLLAVHINHQLRGAESDADEAAVKRLCLTLNVPLIIRRIRVEKRNSQENQARKARFSIFDEVMANYGYNKIALAHHREDQAETVVLNMLRGSGISGMAGIKPFTGIVIHPLLCFSKPELESLLATAKIPWCSDSSNLDNGFTRNRIRNELMPLLRRDYNPAVGDHLCSLAEIFLQAEEILSERSKQQYRRVTLDYSPSQVSLELRPLLKMYPLERYYLYRKAYRLVSKVETDFLAAHFKAIEDILCAEGSKILALPHGVVVKKLYEEIQFLSESKTPEITESCLEIDADRARAVFGNYRFTFKHLRILPTLPEAEEQALHIIIDEDKIKLPFKIRFRQPGDRFIPLGMGNFKKLKEFFIDEKVPKYERNLLPVFDDGDKIFWITGYRIDNRVKRDETSSRYLQIIAEPLSTKPKRAIQKKKRGNDESDEL